MLTPKDIAEKTFDRTFGFGYRMDSVDEYLEQVSAALQEQIDKNADLTKKLEVLAEKLTVYRNDEESLRTALLGAQKLGDSVIRESRTKAEIIMRDANIKAETLVANAKRQIENEQAGFEKLQNEVSSFKDRLVELYRSHLELISTIPGRVETPMAAAAAAERAIDEAPETAEPAPEAAVPAEHEPAEAAETAAQQESEDISFTPAAAVTQDIAPAGDNNDDDDFDLDDDGDFTAPISSKFGELRFGEAFRLDSSK